MQIDRNTYGDITLSQEAYCKRLLKQFNITSYSPATTPLPPGIILSIEDCPATPDEENKMKDTLFWKALGLLMWLQVTTRLDLAFSVNILARFAHNPGKAHWNTLKHILAYVQGTKYYGITYKGSSSLELIKYIDFNYTGYKDTRQSTKGNIFLVAGGPISWECKRQDTVALSTIEAEFMAFLKATT